MLEAKYDGTVHIFFITVNPIHSRPSHVRSLIDELIEAFH